MGNFLTLGISIAATLLAAWVLAAFKVKQLYLVVPKLFAFSALTDKGAIVEMQVFNKGRSTEEDVHIDLPPNINYELIAADLSNTTIENTAVILPRLPPLSEASVIVLAETNVELSSANIRISSKTTKGRVLKKVADVPPNIGRYLAGFLGVIALFALLVSMPDLLTSFRKWRSSDEITSLTELGWTDFDSFFVSAVRDSYKHNEFPFKLLSATADGKNLVLTFNVLNKTGSEAKISAYFKCTNGDKLGRCPELKGDKALFDYLLDPLQSTRITVAADLSQIPSIEKAYVYFYLEVDYQKRKDLVDAMFHPLKNMDSLVVLRAMKQTLE